MKTDCVVALTVGREDGRVGCQPVSGPTIPVSAGAGYTEA